MIILFKFILEIASVLLRYNSVKVVIELIVIASSLVLLQYSYK